MKQSEGLNLAMGLYNRVISESGGLKTKETLKLLMYQSSNLKLSGGLQRLPNSIILFLSEKEELLKVTGECSQIDRDNNDIEKRG